MKNGAIKSILLESLKAAEKTVEKNLKHDEDTKKTVQYLLQFFKFLGVDVLEKLALEGKNYVNHKVEEGIQKTTVVTSKLVSSLINAISLFLIVCVGLIFAAIALSLWLGSLVNSTALGFLLAGLLWILVTYTFTKVFFSKQRLEHLISKKFNTK